MKEASSFCSDIVKGKESAFIAYTQLNALGWRGLSVNARWISTQLSNLIRQFNKTGLSDRWDILSYSSIETVMATSNSLDSFLDAVKAIALLPLSEVPGCSSTTLTPCSYTTGSSHCSPEHCGELKHLLVTAGLLAHFSHSIYTNLSQSYQGALAVYPLVKGKPVCFTKSQAEGFSDLSNIFKITSSSTFYEVLPLLKAVSEYTSP